MAGGAASIKRRAGPIHYVGRRGPRTGEAGVVVWVGVRVDGWMCRGGRGGGGGSDSGPGVEGGSHFDSDIFSRAGSMKR